MSGALRAILAVLVLGLGSPLGCSNAQKEQVKEAVCGPEEPCPECRACPMCPRPPLPPPLPPMSQIDRLEQMQYLRQRMERAQETIRRNLDRIRRADCRLNGWSPHGDCSKSI